MSQLIPHIRQAFPLLNQEGSKRMPEIMQADTSHPCLGQDPVKSTMAEIIPVQWLPCFITKHPRWQVFPSTL
jgi:hypothetical protein